MDGSYQRYIKLRRNQKFIIQNSKTDHTENAHLRHDKEKCQPYPDSGQHVAGQLHPHEDPAAAETDDHGGESHELQHDPV